MALEGEFMRHCGERLSSHKDKQAGNQMSRPIIQILSVMRPLPAKSSHRHNRGPPRHRENTRNDEKISHNWEPRV